MKVRNKPNKDLFYALAITGIVLAGILVILVPGRSMTILFAAWLTVFTPIVLLAQNISKQNYFNIITIYSLIFLLEGFGGALAGMMPSPLPGHKPISEPLLFKSLMIYLAGYLLFLCGFYLYRRICTRAAPYPRSMSQVTAKALPVYLSKGHWHRLLLLVTIPIGLGFVKVFYKIQAAGGLVPYVYFMYKYRYGSFAPDVAQNAWVSLAGQLNNLALPMVMLGFAAWVSKRIPKLYRNILFFLLAVLLFQKFTSGFRSVIFFTLLSMIMVYDSVKPIRVAGLFGLILILAAFLIAVNFIHEYLYFLTAGWDRQSFTATLARLLAPQGHLITLSSVLAAASINPPLHGEGLLESIFFFIPRLIWHSKAEAYGTIIVQQWAYLPDWYQKAPTNIGELIAHFGYPSILAMILVGGLHGWLEGFHRSPNPLMRMGYFCIVLPRLLVHLGMGINALSITIFSLALLYGTSFILGLTRKAHRPQPRYGLRKSRTYHLVQ